MEARRDGLVRADNSSQSACTSGEEEAAGARRAVGSMTLLVGIASRELPTPAALPTSFSA
jgi:hypothetical protein